MGFACTETHPCRRAQGHVGGIDGEGKEAQDNVDDDLQQSVAVGPLTLISNRSLRAWQRMTNLSGAS